METSNVFQMLLDTGKKRKITSGQAFHHALISSHPRLLTRQEISLISSLSKVKFLLRLKTWSWALSLRWMISNLKFFHFILSSFKVNAVTNQSNIAPNLLTRISEIYDHFQLETIPVLVTLIELFRGLQETLPFDIHDCLQVDVVRMTDESLVLRNTLELCWALKSCVHDSRINIFYSTASIYLQKLPRNFSSKLQNQIKFKKQQIN